MKPNPVKLLWVQTYLLREARSFVHKYPSSLGHTEENENQMKFIMTRRIVSSLQTTRVVGSPWGSRDLWNAASYGLRFVSNCLLAAGGI